MNRKWRRKVLRDSEEKGMKSFHSTTLRKGEKLMKQTEKMSTDGEVNITKELWFNTGMMFIYMFY